MGKRFKKLAALALAGTLAVFVFRVRGVALGRHNRTFAGSDRGGERAAAIYTLIGTGKLNGVGPQAWLADVLARLPDHPARRVADLLPWNRRAAA